MVLPVPGKIPGEGRVVKYILRPRADKILLTRESGGGKFPSNMTLQDLMKPLGINDYAELARRSRLSKQLAHQLWNGKALPGLKSARAISQGTGLKLELILAVVRDGNASHGDKARPSPATR